jgi:subtilisin family serine protease
MRRMIRVSLAAAVLSLTLAPFALADENPGHMAGQRVTSTERFVLTPAHPLTADEQGALRGLGVTFEHALPGGRYMVRVAGDDPSDVAAAPTVASIVQYMPSQKIYRAAYAAASRQLGGTVRLTVRFHDDVSLDEARTAVAAAGGALESPFVTKFNQPKEIVIHMPASSLLTLAADQHVLLIDGPPRRKTSLNAVAAQLSHVTQLFTAPYGLSGNGIVMSTFEADDPPQANHPEFGSRLINDTSYTGGNGQHATHTSGTIIAAGINAPAKGMAPQGTLRAFDARADTSVIFDKKQNVVTALGSVSDNNSWGFCLGWQPAGSGCAGNRETWNGCPECFGGYDGSFVAPYDNIAHSSSTVYVHSAGNDGFTGTPDFGSTALEIQYSAHYHVDDSATGDGSAITTEVFCYSQNGSGTDCPTPLCTAGTSKVTLEAHCETSKHPTYGPFNTMGLSASGKDVIAVGAVDQFSEIATFSSRGPAADGRVKPDLVTKGVHQYSTVPVSSYQYNQGTSMAAPVVTGILGLMAEQWKKTFGKSATPQQLKTLLIAGADDLGNPGPDYTYGFGLVDAQASADLVIADAAQGNRIRNGTLSAKQTLSYPLTVSGGQSLLRVVLGWFDPEVTGLGDSDLAGRTLVNDLDVKVLTPSGGTVLPYVLNLNNPNTNATRGVNSVDNTEEVEIANPQAGTYQVVVTANTIGDTTSSTQDFVLIANAALSAPSAPCTDAYEPNDTVATAYGDVVSGTSISAKICSSADLDFFRFLPNKSGTVTVHVTATDTALTVTEFNASGNATSNTVNVAAGQSGNLTFFIPGAQREYVRISATGAIGATGAYTATITYPFTTPSHRHVAGR